MVLYHKNSHISRKRSLGMKLDFTYGMTHLYLGEVHIKLSEGVYLKINKLKFWKNVTQHNIEVIFHYKGHIKRSSNLVSIGQHYLETVLNGSSYVTNVKEWATSTKEMKFLFKQSWLYKFLMSRE